jgi:hypothetical protein
MRTKLALRGIPASLASVYALAVLTAQPVTAPQAADPFAGMYPSLVDAQEALSSNVFPQMVETQGRGFLVFRPRVITSGAFQQNASVVSRDGRRAVVALTDSKEPLKMRLVDYDVRTGSTRDWALPEGFLPLNLVEVGNRYYTILTRRDGQTDSTVVRVMAGSNPRPLQAFPGEVVTDVAPAGNGLVVVSSNAVRPEVRPGTETPAPVAAPASPIFRTRLFDANDRLIVNHAFINFSEAQWLPDRNQLLLVQRVAPPPGQRRPTFQYFLGNPATGQTQPISEEDLMRGLDQQPWAFMLSTTWVGGDTPDRAVVGWLTDTERLEARRRRPVTPGESAPEEPEPAELGEAPLIAAVEFINTLAIGQRGLVIQADRTAWFVPIVEVPAADVDRLGGIIESRRLVSRAKQVGTALMIYAADYENQLPPGDNWQERVMPYIKNSDLMRGFQYMGAGQNMAQMQSPSETLLGIVVGKYGRVLVFADSSARWEPLRP